MQKFKEYLPSKHFALMASACIVLGVIIFLVFFMPSWGENFGGNKEKKELPLKIENQSVIELVQKDSDSDGIPDWEESLWGTDKNKKITYGDTPDADYVAGKKEELKTEESEKIEEERLTETEKFARQFFASYTAMKTSGQIDTETINGFSSALGQRIVNPVLSDQYAEKDARLTASDDIASWQKYYQTTSAMFQTYKESGLGDELEIVSTAIATNEAGGYIDDLKLEAELTLIGEAYQEFGKKVIETPVPKSLMGYHIRIANNAYNTGASVLSMIKVVSDPIIGLSGLSQYQKYSDELVKSVSELEAFLSGE